MWSCEFYFLLPTIMIMVVGNKFIDYGVVVKVVATDMKSKKKTR